MDYETIDKENLWTPDEFLMNLIYRPVFIARDQQLNSDYEKAVLSYRHTWNVLKTEILKKMSRISEDSDQYLAFSTYIGQMDEYIEQIRPLLIPTKTPNPLQHAQEERDRIFRLEGVMHEMESLLFSAMANCNLWFKTVERLPKGQSIKEKFRL